MRLMKLIFAVILLSMSSSIMAKPQLCSLKHAPRAIRIAEKHSSYDKNRHCTVSCMLAIRCNNTEVLMVGYLKEFRDLMGPGNAETQDIVADRYGIHLVKYQRARTDKECLTQCDLRY